MRRAYKRLPNCLRAASDQTASFWNKALKANAIYTSVVG
jgi:hypothetical protein